MFSVMAQKEMLCLIDKSSYGLLQFFKKNLSWHGNCLSLLKIMTKKAWYALDKGLMNYKVLEIDI